MSLCATRLRYGVLPASASLAGEAAKLPSVTPTTIYRIVAADVWQRAEAAGSFTGTEHDLRDGFIHFSTAEQVPETAARHYAGQTGLLLVAVNAAALGAALRWEPSRGGALFPHLYAPLPTTAATSVTPLPLDPNGLHVVPELA